ncbi:uncharacterized protein LOC123315868 isoform X2 [Coccinella septempunctata]|uniref:uncharacterized protein LOC123315868 isoform X2 n=1 Tax=Coccinella septempunctata TaxID=41139 RepID=UPI001D06A667|nr:uncharacterized protein LOC123315868 isoform X2 [Coccinella septempunctata]
MHNEVGYHSPLENKIRPCNQHLLSLLMINLTRQPNTQNIYLLSCFIIIQQQPVERIFINKYNFSQVHCQARIMSEDSKPKSLTDDFEKLFDLIKEGASYLLHIYLYLVSKTFPLEFIENLFDHHKNSSSYDYSKEGKTYIYRLFNSIFEVEKQIVAMALQYIYSYIPLPFINTIYENFCINNNLECTDVKLKKCKKALINSSKDSKKKPSKQQNTNEDNDLVSRPFPLIPQNPVSKIENTSGESVAPVSKNIPPSVDFGTSFEKTIEQNNKALKKNMEDFGQSIANVFSGGVNAPTAGPSANA